MRIASVWCALNLYRVISILLLLLYFQNYYSDAFIH